MIYCHRTLSGNLLLRVGALLTCCLFVTPAFAVKDGTVNQPALPAQEESAPKRKVPSDPTATSVVAEYPDYVVIEAVLKDLLSYPEFNPTAQNAERTSQVILSEKTPVHSVAPPLFMLTTQEQRDLPEKVWKHLLARSESYPPLGAYQTDPLYARSFWRKYTPSDSRILVKDMDWALETVFGLSKYQFKKYCPKAKGYIMPWLPGYSQDLKTAVVHFRYGPMWRGCFPSGGWGTYLLVNSNGKWAIERKWLIK